MCICEYMYVLSSCAELDCRSVCRQDNLCVCVYMCVYVHVYTSICVCAERLCGVRLEVAVSARLPVCMRVYMCTYKCVKGKCVYVNICMCRAIIRS